MSSPCDQQPCLGKLKELADAKADADAAWDDLLAAATAAGFAGGGSAALIFWLAEKAAEAAIPGWGWVILIVTGVLVAAALALWIRYKIKKSTQQDKAKEVRDSCPVQCWPSYIQ